MLIINDNAALFNTPSMRSAKASAVAWSRVCGVVSKDMVISPLCYSFAPFRPWTRGRTASKEVYASFILIVVLIVVYIWPSAIVEQYGDEAQAVRNFRRNSTERVRRTERRGAWGLVPLPQDPFRGWLASRFPLPRPRSVCVR